MRRFSHYRCRRSITVKYASTLRHSGKSVALSVPLVVSAYAYSHSTVAAPTLGKKAFPPMASSFSFPTRLTRRVFSLSTLSSLAPSSFSLVGKIPSRSISYAAGLFHDRLCCDEIIPYPTKRFPGDTEDASTLKGNSKTSAKSTNATNEEQDEGENLVMLISQLTEGNSTNLNTSVARTREVVGGVAVVPTTEEGEKEKKAEGGEEGKEGDENSYRLFYGARIPSAYGGLGLGCTSYAYVCEEAGRVGRGGMSTTNTVSPSSSSSIPSSTGGVHPSCLNSVLCTLPSSSLAYFLLSTWGSKELNGKHLTQMSDGSEVLGWAVLESHGAGPDVSMNRTMGRLGQSQCQTPSPEERKEEGMTRCVDEDVNAFYITGEKLCAFAHTATHFLVLGKTPIQENTPSGPAESLKNTFFLVPKNTPGVEVQTIPKVHTNTSSPSSSCDGSMSRVVFSNAKAEAVVGNAGEGHRMQLVSTMSEQFAWVAALLGALKSMFQEVEEVEKEIRKRQEKWVGSASSSPSLLAFGMPLLYAMEATLYAVTANKDRQAEDILLELCFMTGFVRHHASILLNALMCWSESEVAAPSRKDANVISSSPYATIHALLANLPPLDYLRAIVISSGAEEFGLQFQATSTMSVMQKRILTSVGVREKLPLTQVDCRPLDAALLRFATAVEQVFLRHTSSLPHQQLLLNRLGEAGELAYSATAAASRAAMAIQKGVSTAKTEKLMAEVFMKDACLRMNALCDLCRNSGKTVDDITKRISLLLCDSAARRARI